MRMQVNNKKKGEEEDHLGYTKKKTIRFIEY